MKMRPGTQTGFLMCGKEWIDGEALEVHSPWDQGLVGRVTIPTRADARTAVSHAVASLRRTRSLPRWKRREILENVAAALIEQRERFAQLIVAEARNTKSATASANNLNKNKIIHTVELAVLSPTSTACLFF